MFDTINPQELWNGVVTWCSNYFWTTDTLYQSIIILISLVLGSLFYRFTRARVSDAIDKAELPFRIKRVFNNIKRLIIPIVTILVMLPITFVAKLGIMDVETTLAIGVIKVLVAWIVIRMSVQFIGNTLVRNFFSLSTLMIAALSIFGILDETTIMLDAFGFNLGTFRLSALALIKGTLSIFVLLYLATFVSTFAERRVLKSKNLTRSSQVLVAKLIRITLITFAFLIGITSAGIDLSIFAVFSGAVGLGVGFGLQKVVSNLFSGLLLLVDKSITPGDVIELEDSGTFGWVKHMGARYTEIITRDNKSYLIPNEDFVTQRVVNWSHGDKLIRIQVDFGVHYDSDPHEVITIAIEAAKRPERVVETPEPVCWLLEFGDSSLNFTLRFWIKDAEEGVTNVQGNVMLALWDAFKENNIEIPYPHREVFVHEVKPKK